MWESCGCMTDGKKLSVVIWQSLFNNGGRRRDCSVLLEVIVVVARYNRVTRTSCSVTVQ